MFKKLIFLILAAALALSLAAPALAEEVPATEETEPTEATAPPTEAPTKAPTEAPTEVPTEAPAEAPTEPPVETTVPPTETPPTEPTAPQFPTALTIDSRNTYSGMDMAYEDGYMPRIEDGYMRLVLPLVPSGEIYEDKIEATLSLDTSAASPFVVENFRKTFYLEPEIPENTDETQWLFLLDFYVALSDNRTNGTYPVTVNVKGFDSGANPVDCSFTLYVTITDGKSNIPKPPAVEKPTAEPVVYISKSVLEPENPQAGEEFTLRLTLQNSLTTKSVKNMLVTVSTGNVQIDLNEDGSVFPVEKLEPGGETELTLRFKTDPSIPSGKYPLNFSFKYDSNVSLNLSSSGTVTVPIRQGANMELVMPRVTSSVTVGETVPLSFQVMNMGRSAMHNVRCTVSGFGLVPSNTGYIGTMAPGSSATTKVELYIIALNASEGNENGQQYGDTTGTVTLLFEDESGTPCEQRCTFETRVDRQVVDLSQATPPVREEETAGQWWISVSILGGVILAAIAGIFLVRKKGRRSRL